jgi:hypothetical protein
MWGTREPFLPAAAMVLASHVIRLLKNTIKTLKLVVCNQFLYVLIYIGKHIKIHVSLIVAWTKPKLYGGRSLNHFSQMEPGILGIAGKLLSS